jgi:hypothetical protein
MALDQEDARYILFLWLDPAGEGEPDHYVEHRSEEVLQDTADKMIAAGRYKYWWLGGPPYDEARGEWTFVDEYELPSSAA